MSSYFEPPSANVTGAAATARTGTTQVSFAVPQRDFGVNVVAGAIWVLGAWTQLIAAGNIGSAMLIGVLAGNGGGAVEEFELEIGQGGAGAEVKVATVIGGELFFSPAAWIPYRYFSIVPGVALTTNARLAARVAHNIAAATVVTKLILLPTPA